MGRSTSAGATPATPAFEDFGAIPYVAFTENCISDNENGVRQHCATPSTHWVVGFTPTVLAAEQLTGDRAGYLLLQLDTSYEPYPLKIEVATTGARASTPTPIRVKTRPDVKVDTVFVRVPVCGAAGARAGACSAPRAYERRRH